MQRYRRTQNSYLDKKWRKSINSNEFVDNSENDSANDTKLKFHQRKNLILKLILRPMLKCMII